MVILSSKMNFMKFKKMLKNPNNIIKTIKDINGKISVVIFKEEKIDN